MTRKISALLVLAMLSGLVSGCGTAENSDSSAPSSDAAGESQASSQAATDEEITIEVRWANIPESTQKVWRENVFAPFEEEHPNVTVDFQSLPNQDQTLRVQLSAGSGPDMFRIDTTDVSEFAKTGFIADLQSYREEYKLDEKMYDWALRACEYDGNLYALPAAVETSDLTYNKTLLDQLGMPVPKTREEFVQACEAAQENGLVAVSWGYSGVPALMGWFYGHYLTTYSGPENVKKLLNGEITFNDPNIRGAFELMKADWDAGYYNDKKSGAISMDEARSLFNNSKSVFNMEGSWLTMADTEPGTWQFEWGQTQWPSMREGVPAAGDMAVGGCIGINAASECVELCADMMIEFYLDQDRVAQAVSQGYSTPALDIDESLYPSDMHEDIKTALECQKEIINADAIGYAPWGFFPTKMKAFLDDNLDKVLYDQMSIDDFLSQAQALLEEDIENGYQFPG